VSTRKRPDEPDFSLTSCFQYKKKTMWQKQKHNKMAAQLEQGVWLELVSSKL
jgi:hypothetical protein